MAPRNEPSPEVELPKHAPGQLTFADCQTRDFFDGESFSFREDARTLQRRLLDAAEMVERVILLGNERRRTMPERRASLVKYLALRHAQPDQEVMGAVYVDIRDRLIADFEVYRGTLGCVSAEPRTFLRKALECGAAAMVLWHTHPSGNPAPSAEDLTFTNRMAQAGKVIGVRLLDHLVIGNGSRWVSLEARGSIPRDLAPGAGRTGRRTMNPKQEDER